jgi:hypothetical protein
MSDNSQTKRARASGLASLWFFFLLVILISIPFYVLGAAGGRLPIATFLPLSAIMAFVPMLAALILVYWGSGVSGAKTFLSRALDYRRIKGVGWVLTALLLMPIVFLLAHGLFRFEGRAAGCEILSNRRDRCVRSYVLRRRHWRGARLAGILDNTRESCSVVAPRVAGVQMSHVVW